MISRRFVLTTQWRGGRASDLQSRAHGFYSWSGSALQHALGKLFTVSHACASVIK